MATIHMADIYASNGKLRGYTAPHEEYIHVSKRKRTINRPDTTLRNGNLLIGTVYSDGHFETKPMVTPDKKSGRKLVRRKRLGFLFIEPTAKPARVLSKPKKEKGELVVKKITTSATYVFRDPFTGKVISRSKVGSLPHLYR